MFIMLYTTSQALIYLFEDLFFFFFPVLGLPCCEGFFSSSYREWGYSSLWCLSFSVVGLLIAGTRLSPSDRLSVRGLSCSEACGIFLDRDGTVSPALAGRFLSTSPPGQSPYWCLCDLCLDSVFASLL